MAWTQADVDALKDAIKAGRKKVKYADKEVEYHSLAEQLQLLDRMELSVRSTGRRKNMSVGTFYGE